METSGSFSFAFLDFILAFLEDHFRGKQFGANPPMSQFWGKILWGRRETLLPAEIH